MYIYTIVGVNLGHYSLLYINQTITFHNIAQHFTTIHDNSRQITTNGNKSVSQQYSIYAYVFAIEDIPFAPSLLRALLCHPALFYLQEPTNLTDKKFDYFNIFIILSSQLCSSQRQPALHCLSSPSEPTSMLQQTMLRSFWLEKQM